MRLNYCCRISIILILISLTIKAQSLNEDLYKSPYVFTINLNDIDSLGIDSITVFKYLSDSVKKSRKLNNNIFSKRAVFYFDKNKLIKDSWSYSGIDSTGKDHLAEKNSEFYSVPFVFENYYYYKNDTLYKVDQNVPFKTFSGNLIEIDNALENQILINDIPFVKFKEMFLNTDKDEYLIQISKSLSLYFKINQ
ncbi:MAG: hypothetical protein Kow0068_19440 [Marinilabiliales bacterium]